MDLPNDAVFTYERDIRSSGDSRRHGRFKAGWNHAVDSREYGERVLKQLTWQNLGWRFGMYYGDKSEEFRDELYESCKSDRVQ